MDGIVDETNGFGLDVIEKTDSRFLSPTPDVGAVSTLEKDGFGACV